MLTWTGVGSRKTPRNVLRQCYWIGYQYTLQGGLFRSGGAPKTDTAFQLGVRRGVDELNRQGLHTLLVNHQQIFLPQVVFNGNRANPLIGVHDTPLSPHWDQAIHIARSVAPHIDHIGEFGFRAHTRNVFQVLGPDLNDPSEFTVYYAIPKRNGQIGGGTRTAVLLSEAFGVPTYNLYYPDTLPRLMEEQGL